MQICDEARRSRNLDLVVISPFGSNRTVNQARRSGSWALDEVLFVSSSHVSSFVQRLRTCGRDRGSGQLRSSRAGFKPGFPSYR